jgi:membrane protease YdiL (CAAX protease family)
MVKYKKLIFVLCLTLIMVVTLYLIDQTFQLNYFIKSGAKIGLFAIGISLYIIVFKYNYLTTSFKNFKFSKKLTRVHWFGLFLIGFLVGVFFIFKQFINVDVMSGELVNKYHVTKGTIYAYGAYIIFINAFLEELFFRGFIFLNLREAGFKKTAYLVSSLTFAIYHISVFQSWFAPWIMVLFVFGLALGGIIFAYVDDKTETFLNSWFIHMCADVGIIIIGILIVNGVV